MEILLEKNILLDIDVKTKEEAFDEVSKIIAQNGYVDDYKIMSNYFNERESQIATGLEDGLAIPHGKGEKVKSSGIFYVRFKNALKWETFDGTDVTDAIFFCIPDKKGDLYLKNLATISGALSSKDFRNQLRNAKNSKQVFYLLSNAIKDDTDKENTNNVLSSTMILGVVACPAGLAHTYMAKKAIEDAAKKLNYACKVEAHGAMGIENKISANEVKKATVLIMATDVGVDVGNRFDTLNTLECRTADVIKDAKGIILKALKVKNKKSESSNDEFIVENELIEGKNKFTRFMKWWGRDTLKHLMTAISYLIPLAIASSVLIAISRLIASAAGENNLWDYWGSKDGQWNSLNDISGWKGFLFSLDYIGTNYGLGTLFIPFICAFICFSMNGKAGLAPGFLVGFVAGGLQEGFIGGMVAGLLTGYVIRFVSKYMRIRGSWASMTPILFVPVISTLVGGVITWWGLGFPFHALNEALKNGLTSLTKTNAGGPAIAAIVALMIAFDLGGPVNKAAYTIAIGLLTKDATNDTMSEAARYIPNTAVQISIILPPLGLGIASFVGHSYYDDDIKDTGKAAFIMGLVGVSEGAIPFAIKNPIRVTIINILGCVAAAVTCVALGSYQEVSLSAFYSWGFPTKPAIYIMSVMIGLAIIVVGNVFFQKIYFHKKTQTTYKFFNPIPSYKNFGIAIANIFRKKDNKKAYVETSVKKFLRENGIDDVKALYQTDASVLKEQKRLKKEAKKAQQIA